MAEHRFTIDIAAPPERVFGLWMDLDRMKEWVGGVTRVTDVTGPIDTAGTRYSVRFGPMKSQPKSSRWSPRVMCGPGSET